MKGVKGCSHFGGFRPQVSNLRRTAVILRRTGRENWRVLENFDPCQQLIAPLQEINRLPNFTNPI
jgi:hypothetical protein